MNEDQRASERKKLKFGEAFSVLIGAIGVVVGIFAALSASRLDVISLLGLDSIFVTKDIFAERDISLKLFVNILAAILLALIFFVFRERVRERSAVAEEDVGTSFKDSATTVGAQISLGPNTKPQEAAIASLNKRIAALTLRATTIYWTMILGLITGVVLIIFAGYLSSFDTTFSNLSSKIDSDRQEALQSFGRLFQQRNEKTFTAADNNAFDYAFGRIKTIDENYGELLKTMIHQSSDRADNKPVWNWPSTILRIGVIGLLVFLTQILISLYRYNSRLIAFYGSRRDALLLCGEHLEKLDDLAKLMFPANLDFGSEPRHPFQELSDLIRKRPSDQSRSRSGARQQQRNRSAKNGREQTTTQGTQ